jgi:AcrR family transcriptional regulator
VPATTRNVRSGRTQAERRATSERRLLDAAAKVIAERGTTGVSFADIAREAGCSHGLPGYLFGSKTDLLLALVEDVLREFRVALVRPAVGDRRGLPALLGTQRAFLESLVRPYPYTRAIYVMIGEAAGAPPELQAALNVHQDAVRQMIADLLREGIELGHVRPDVDPAAQAVVVFGALRGIGLQSLMDPASVDVKAVTAEVLASTERALAAEGWVNDEVEAKDHVG